MHETLRLCFRMTFRFFPESRGTDKLPFTLSGHFPRGASFGGSRLSSLSSCPCGCHTLLDSAEVSSCTHLRVSAAVPRCLWGELSGAGSRSVPFVSVSLPNLRSTVLSKLRGSLRVLLLEPHGEHTVHIAGTRTARPTLSACSLPGPLGAHPVAGTSSWELALLPTCVAVGFRVGCRLLCSVPSAEL